MEDGAKATQQLQCRLGRRKWPPRFLKHMIFCYLFGHRASSQKPFLLNTFSQDRKAAALSRGKDTSQVGRVSRSQFLPARSLIYRHHLWEDKWPLLAVLARCREGRKEGKKNGGRQISKSINIQVTYNEWTNRSPHRKVVDVLRWWCWIERGDTFLAQG